MKDKAGEASGVYSSARELERQAFIARLRSLIPERGENAFAKRAGISGSGLRGALAGGNPGRELAVAIARAAHVNLDWLLTGEGPRDGPKPDSSGQKPGASVVGRGKASIDNEVDAHVFFGVVSAVQRLEEEIPVDKAVDMAMRMHYALEMLAVHDEALSRLDDQDLDALARIARKLA